MPVWLRACRPCRHRLRLRRTYSWWSGPPPSNAANTAASSEMNDKEPTERPNIRSTTESTIPPTPPPRIHIVGTGNVGCLVAHSLRGIYPRPPITLLVHRRAIAEDFDAIGRVIIVEREGLTISRRGYDIELSNKHIEALLPGVQHSTATANQNARRPGQIDHLIVTTKMHQTKVALEPLLQRLTPNSTIAFIQNGMGIVEELNNEVFPNPTSRPHYIMGITTHGVSSPQDPYEPFTVIRNGIGNLKLGVIPPEQGAKKEEFNPSVTPQLNTLPPTTSYLLHTLTSSLDLVATHVSPEELLATQVEKLAVNSIINPLTTIFQCNNGTLLYNFHASKVMKLLLWETSQVIRALPELRHLQNRELRFSAESIYATVVRVAKATEGNTSSMLQDVRKGRNTEVDYINGYIVRKGLELGVPCTMNYLVQCMVKAREKIGRVERDAEVPFEGIDL